jgi:hypothetical protein
MSKGRTRRISWRGGLLATAMLVLAGCGGEGPGDVEPGADGPANPPESGPSGSPTEHVRQEISSLSPDQIAAFRAGVALMQSRDETDPTSWLYQANIHGFPADSSICAVPGSSPQPSWATCQHGNFFFLAWHRMYLYYFERILRASVQEATGDPEAVFALPYWDYEVDGNLPEPLREPTADNPLYVSARAGNCNTIDSNNPCVSPTEASTTEAMSRLPFCGCIGTDCTGCTSGLLPSQTFGGRFTAAPVHLSSGFGELESQPHNVVHDVVGGPTGWMAYVECAARDATFWLHHANIDRLWQVWLNQGDRQNPLDADNWKNQQFTFFDADGSAVTLTGCQVLNMATQLDYQYEGLPVDNVVLCEEGEAPRGVAPRARESELLAAAEPAETRLANAQVKVKVPMTGAISERVVSLAGEETPGKVWAVVEGLQRLQPGAYYQVYLNLPPGQEPDPRGPHHVGNISLFGAGHHGPEEGVERAFDISDEVSALRERGLWTGEVELTFVRGNPEAGAPRGGDAFISFRRVRVIGH